MLRGHIPTTDRAPIVRTRAAALARRLVDRRARVRASGARTGAEATQFRIADLEVDLTRRKATRAGQRLDLTPKEFSLLALLLRRQGHVLSRTEIAEQVWDMNFDSETNVVEVAVRRLRSKMDQPFERHLLHTVRGMGYVLEERAS